MTTTRIKKSVASLSLAAFALAGVAAVAGAQDHSQRPSDTVEARVRWEWVRVP